MHIGKFFCFVFSLPVNSPCPSHYVFTATNNRMVLVQHLYRDVGFTQTLFCRSVYHRSCCSCTRSCCLLIVVVRKCLLLCLFRYHASHFCSIFLVAEFAGDLHMILFSIISTRRLRVFDCNDDRLVVLNAFGAVLCE
jgi:hypothetical protein